MTARWIALIIASLSIGIAGAEWLDEGSDQGEVGSWFSDSGPDYGEVGSWFSDPIFGSVQGPGPRDSRKLHLPNFGEDYLFNRGPIYYNSFIDPFFPEIPSGFTDRFLQEMPLGFTEPYFLPDFNHTDADYYPYFGEEFFSSGHKPGEASQHGIETQRQRLERAYYDLFGERIFGN
jgi:hypothetical protein